MPAADLAVDSMWCGEYSTLISPCEALLASSVLMSGMADTACETQDKPASFPRLEKPKKSYNGRFCKV